MRNAGAFSGLDPAGLRRRLLLLFLALATPIAILVWQAFSEMKWEAFHRHGLLAEELAARIDQAYSSLIDQEEARPFTDFSFLNVVGSGGSNLLQRSVLAAYPPASPIPGALGYFQINAKGELTTPYLPTDVTLAARYGLSKDELDRRLDLSLRIRSILSDNRLVAAAPATGKRDMVAKEQEVDSAAVGDSTTSSNKRKAANILEPSLAERKSSALQPQAAFDRLRQVPQRKPKRAGSAAPSRGIARLDDLNLAEPFSESMPKRPSPTQRSMRDADIAPTIRKERSQLPLTELEQEEGEVRQWPAQVPVTTFESELDRYQFSRLADGHYVLFRNVWRDGQRYIQGVLLKEGEFVQQITGAMFQSSLLASMSDLLLAYQGDVQRVFSAQKRYDYLSSSEMQGALLYRTSLSAPLDDIDLLFSVRNLPPGAGVSVIAWSAVVLFLVLCGGLLMIYRLGLRQIDLTRQQQEFVSAVSHELKTPLTSIRMYGEMLMRGWVDETRRSTYYRYIFDEGERLSRLIENVLQFARMSRGQHSVTLVEISVGELLEEIQPRLTARAEQAGFTLTIDCEQSQLASRVCMDRDALTQIMLNLVDNAVKFSAASERREVEIGCQTLSGSGSQRLWVRDYGPGVARDQQRKIFAMFYRSEDEMTRETQGTGIGLALVQRLVSAMDGQVEVINRQPGAEFQLTFPLKQ